MPCACEVDGCAREVRQGRTLKVVLALNAVMFIVELAAGLAAGSTALLSDSLDNLGDALTYGLSLYAVPRGARAKAQVAVFKGALILAAGLFVLGQVAYRIAFPTVPLFETMGTVGAAALLANASCVSLLWKHRGEDVNMSSVWECARNDIASNLALFVAAAGVWLTGSGWPDVAIGFALALLFLWSAARVLRASLKELRAHPAPRKAPGRSVEYPDPQI